MNLDHERAFLFALFTLARAVREGRILFYLARVIARKNGHGYVTMRVTARIQMFSDNNPANGAAREMSRQSTVEFAPYKSDTIFRNVDDARFYLPLGHRRFIPSCPRQRPNDLQPVVATRIISFSRRSRDVIFFI